MRTRGRIPPTWLFGAIGEAARSHATLVAGLLALALPAVALAGNDPAVAGVWKDGELFGTVTTAIVPAKLPRSQPIPITLRIGFTSKAINSSETPELSKISLEISRNVTFQTAGLPSCPISRLFSYGNARQTCARSLVGHGSVVSEVTLPGKAPATIDGHLMAFYNDEGLSTRSNPHILAQVTSGGEKPFIYVLPFQIERTARAFGTRLIVRHMRRVLGKPVYSGAYQFRGVYGHISKFELSLHRLFRRHGKRESIVSTDCPRPDHPMIDVPFFPLVRVSFAYASGANLRETANWRCTTSG